ncbi:MAG: hypothetical protein ACI3XI_02095 [Eubacteriales bacterium]
MISELEKERFRAICRDVLTVKSKGDGGIGTLNEKRMHIALKRFVCSDENKYEKDMGKRFVADVKLDDEIYEIQTGSLYPLKAKLEHYIATTDCHVTVVHPVPMRKFRVWIDTKTGESLPRTRVRGISGALGEAHELVYISEAIASGRVAVWFLFIEEEEYRFLDGKGKDKRRHSTRFERLPVDLIDEAVFAEKSDFLTLVPEGLPDCFTAEEYRAAAKLPHGKQAYMAIAALANIGLLEETDKKGRAKAWKLK